MPATAVIPAPIAYNMFVAVKMFLVEFGHQGDSGLSVIDSPVFVYDLRDTSGMPGCHLWLKFTMSKSECSKQVVMTMNELAWNNGI